MRLVEHPPFIEAFYDLALRHATGDWILWLDDDELMGAGFAETKDDLLRNRDLTHYYLPYRWVIREADGSERWLSTFPWHPNPRLRLVRNVGSILSHRGRLHSPLDVAGEGRVLSPDEAVVYHLDLAWRSRSAREAKVARYRGNNAPSCEEYYLYEDYARTVSTEPVPEPLDRPPSAAAQAAGSARVRRGLIDPSGPPAKVADEKARIARFWDTAPLFSAEYVNSSTPPHVLANRGYNVEVKVRNTSSVAWRNSGPERGRIMLGYHWLTEQHGVVLREGDYSLLDDVVEPGDTATVLAGLWTPYEPGSYILQWDLVGKDVNWFSERGVAALSVPVTVGSDDLLLSKPRTVAELPPPATDAASGERPTPQSKAGRLQALIRQTAARPRSIDRAHSGLSGQNVVPIRAARALDSRDGSGVPGASNGPLQAGATVTLRLAGNLGIPDYAVGVVATVSVPAADYNGFVNVVAGNGPPSGIVSGYFTDREPAAFQVVSGLEDGRLTLWLSDNWPGTAQLLVDVTAYLR